MVDIQRILCPVDFSEPSRHAVEYAVASARWYGAQITLLHVYREPPMADDVAVLPPIDPQDVVERVRRFCASVMIGGSPEIVVMEGRSAREIARLAEQMPADLLVMGTHGRGGFERLFLGSVTEKVLRIARCPVLAVPPSEDEAAASVLYKTILCPFDFSDASSRALKYAVSLAEKTNACVMPLHVVEGFVEAPDLDVHAHFNVPEYRLYMQKDAMMRLKTATAGIPALCETGPQVVVGKASREILQVAAQTEADLIVMGVHGRGVAARFGVGSTTHRIVSEAPCPVLTLRAD